MTSQDFPANPAGHLHRPRNEETQTTAPTPLFQRSMSLRVVGDYTFFLKNSKAEKDILLGQKDSTG